MEKEIQKLNTSIQEIKNWILNKENNQLKFPLDRKSKQIIRSLGDIPSHYVKFAGTHSYAGGGTSSAATVKGVVSTDIVMAVIKASTNSVSINKATPTTDTVTFTFSANPGASTEVYYIVLRQYNQTF